MLTKAGALGALALTAAIMAASSAAAEVVVFSGFDPAATGPSDKPNSDAARAEFLNAISDLPDVFTNDFEAGVTGRVATSYDLGGGATLASPALRATRSRSALRLRAGSTSAAATPPRAETTSPT